MARLRILTANLLNGGAEAAAFAEIVRDLAVDVACLQELGHEQAEAIASVLPFGKLEPATDHHGMGIALARPADTRHLPLPNRAGRLAWLEPAQWPVLATPLEVLCLHIQAPHSGPPWRTLGLRRQQLGEVMAHLDRSDAGERVVCGDLNATPLWPVYRRLAERLDDVHLAHARGEGRSPRPTWGPLPAGPRVLRIDHVLTSGLRAIHAGPVHVPGSDHSALFVELDTSGEAPAGR